MRIPKSCLSVPRKKKNHPSFVIISLTVVNDASIKGLHEYYSMETKKLDFILKTCSTECFCCHVLQQFLAYTVHIDRSAFLCNP